MFQPNSVIAGRYQVVRLVGQGGMSNLYLAYDRKYSNATVVVKEMTAAYSDPNEQKMAVDLFHREAKLLASLNHRHIPKVYDYFQFAGKYYLSMEYIDGVDLAIKLEEAKGALPEKEVLKWGEQIATVLFYLHKHEPPIVFRDVKPSNIMISSKGVKLIDFGIARHFDKAKKGDTMRIGSPGYAPPEQYAAQTDPRSDIYALGVTLHHALTGRDPTATNTPFLVPPARDLNPNLAESTAAMLARATQLDPSDRYQSALEMKKDIKHILNRNNQSTRVVGAPPALPDEANAPPAATDTTQQKATPAANGPAQKASAQTDPDAQNTPNQVQTDPDAQGQQAQAPATTSGSGSTGSGGLTPAASSSAQLTPPQTSSPAKKKRFRPAAFLAVACLILITVGAVAFQTLDNEKRQELLEKGKKYTSYFMSELSNRSNPEELLRRSILSGTPETLIPLLESEEFQQLSEEKQELFRINMLAAGTTTGPLKMVHLLTPEGTDPARTWEIAALSVRTANSMGGLQKELLVVVPQTYQPGLLEQKLSNLRDSKATEIKQSFLVLSPENESLPATLPDDTLVLSKDLDSVENLSRLRESDLDLARLFQLKLDSSSDPTVWGIPGKVPEGALKADAGLDSMTEKTVEKLIQQAGKAGGRVILSAEHGDLLTEVEESGKVLLLAATPDQLGELPPQLQGEALVLSSPFERVENQDTVQLRPSTQTPLKLPEARIFDAIILSALPLTTPFSGLTVKREQGEYEAKRPTRYRWSKSTWLPLTKEAGQNP